MFRKRNWIFPGIILTVLLFIAGNLAIDFSNGLSKNVSMILQNPSDKIFSNLFRPSDREVGEMIASALTMNEDEIRKLEEENTLPLIENHLFEMHDNPPIVTFKTTEYEIIEKLYWDNRTRGSAFVYTDQKLSLVDRFPVLKRSILNLHVKWLLPKDKLNTNGNIRIRQGGKIVQFQTQYPPSYSTEVSEDGIEYDVEEYNASFPADPKQIDFTLPLEVIVQYSVENDYAVYELDFKKFIN
ncbi:hypothetical protein [Paenibacillus xylanexedens]|uniref:hypothetical protein n=1 Tax=Paenibacillus xylanexedens TaxID=528191 RepID=UPI00119DC725|nr:hypothetical protein [Paenibacillus xylanexedens]